MLRECVFHQYSSFQLEDLAWLPPEAECGQAYTATDCRCPPPQVRPCTEWERQRVTHSPIHHNSPLGDSMVPTVSSWGKLLQAQWLNSDLLGTQIQVAPIGVVDATWVWRQKSPYFKLATSLHKPRMLQVRIHCEFQSCQNRPLGGSEEGPLGKMTVNISVRNLLCS